MCTPVEDSPKGARDIQGTLCITKHIPPTGQADIFRLYYNKLR